LSGAINKSRGPSSARIGFADACFEFINSLGLSVLGYKRAMKTQPNQSNVESASSTPRIVALGLLAALLLVILTGCKGNDKSNSTKLDPTGAIDPTGVYSLVSVDGKTVPCEVSHEGGAMNIQSGTFTITADGACSSAMTISVANRKDMTVVTKANWTRRGAELTMQWTGAGTTLGTVKDSAFAMTNEGMVFAYRK
jgi:hypothetical protein